MNNNFIKYGIYTVGLILFFTMDAYAQYGRRYARVYRSHRVYAYRPVPRISIGIGGYWGSPYYGYGPRVSVGVMLPPIGATLRIIPPDSHRRVINGVTYYYRDDVFYTKSENGQYVVVEPPVGVRVKRLPSGVRKININNQDLYDANGTYYLPQADEEGYATFLVVGNNGQLDIEGAMGNNNNDEVEERANDMQYDERKAIEDEDTLAQDEINHSVSGTGGTTLIRPQIGDQFDQLPTGTKQTIRNGIKEFISTTGVHYKEMRDEDGNLYYEVTAVDK